MYTEAQQDANWDNLTPEQRAYFNRLAEGDPERTGQAFFESEVPPSLQDDPEKLDVFLKGGTVVTEEWDPSRGRGGEYVQVEHKIEAKDWSHDESKANGGSDSAENGRFEDSSTNRSRGARNSTEAEQEAADTQNEMEADILERGTVVEDVDEAAAITAGVEATTWIGDIAGFAMDFAAPVVGGVFAAKVASDRVKEPEHKIAVGTAAGTIVCTTLMTPVGQLALTGYLTYRLGKRIVKFAQKRAKK